ncbi:hypothetical protein PPL_03258 [Heterostelium album PN500]|uniref:N-acetyltransferase domain-containing protein n=1 Tax=Heterostelium pallidum (strain ATCC 26659 / Pp 5 / PN500) TaxID=670386 RepID=D3B4D5_HETP5|nr:hypothetical protein PPL_03258 [Heterostelium album PN500]EFA84183.1 hypothetical protein PPL_03258 [Heterostelium album PN500]|eukprot:XP_020436300.1 hypothetical protein PPL_03258 [Heterostelium album PN500]
MESNFVLSKIINQNTEKGNRSIPRLPPVVDNKKIIAYSHPRSYQIRPSLTPKHETIHAYDKESKRVAGSYSCNIKDQKINGYNKTIVYTFDYSVHPDFRRHGLFTILLRDMINKTHSNDAVISASVLKKPDSPSFKGCMNVGFRYFCDQFQYAWPSDHMIPLEPLPHGCEMQIWEEKDNKFIAERWQAAFGHWNFIPQDFNELLSYNQKYIAGTYFAQMRHGDTVSEASISVWNSDLIFNLSSGSADKSHRQLFSCYSMGEHGDFVFEQLLKHVNNHQHQQGVNFLFAGFSEFDPIRKHFPLFRSIKTLDFAHIIYTSSEEEWNFLQQKKQVVPVYNDPRDYGILTLLRDTPLASL